LDLDRRVARLSGRLRVDFSSTETARAAADWHRVITPSYSSRFTDHSQRSHDVWPWRQYGRIGRNRKSQPVQWRIEAVHWARTKPLAPPIIITTAVN